MTLESAIQSENTESLPDMAGEPAQANTIRHDWARSEIAVLFALPFNDLMFRAQTVHRRNFEANQVQMSTLLSIKTGGCSEDCA